MSSDFSDEAALITAVDCPATAGA